MDGRNARPFSVPLHSFPKGLGLPCRCNALCDTAEIFQADNKLQRVEDRCRGPMKALSGDVARLLRLPDGEFRDPVMNTAATHLPPIRLTHFQAVPEIVAIATSTGGPQALQDLLPQLPVDLPVGIIVVQHMPHGFTGPLAKRLNTISAIEVREAETGELVEAGKVYIAPAGRHITVARHGTNSELRTKICLSDNPLATLHRPSADVLMASVAEVFGRYCCGIILTGMGNDGLKGMTAIRDAGGITIGQDEASSAVYGMPRACAERGILQGVVPLSQMTAQILQALRHTEKAERDGSAKLPGP